MTQKERRAARKERMTQEAKIENDAKGKDVNERDHRGQTALLEATRVGWLAGVSKLLAINADVNLNGLQNRSPLHLALPHGTEMMRTLVEAKANVNCQELNTDDEFTSATFGNRPEHRTPLHYACVNGDSDATALLLGAGANANIQDSEWKTPLHLAIEEDNYEIIDLLLRSGADLNLGNQESGLQNSPLMDASYSGNLKLVEMLLSWKADVNQQGKQEMAALHLAARKGHSQIAAALIEAGANPDQKSKCGTAKELAQKQGSKELLTVFAVEKEEDRFGSVVTTVEQLDAAQRAALFMD